MSTQSATNPSASLTANQVRQQFIDFFKDRAAHTFWPSSPVVPHDDPTLLFANAGMNQYKPIFLGNVEPSSPLAPLKRAANSQKCIRAGGKHNDLDDVGKDTYHHTFFEMLGNWSFGDYFKKEAIDWAWELLTNVWGLDPSRLYATYFEGDTSLGLDADREAYDFWCKYLPAERVLPGNTKDNFWEMGDTGPCGPCSELHYDGRSDDQRAKTPGYQLVNADHPDVIEIWNLVFIQYNREPGGLVPLPAKHVDTGMGFERIVRVLQGKDSNYDTDVFTPIFDRIEQVTGARAYTAGGHEEALKDPINVAYRVIADHIRTLSFAIADGAVPDKDGRGYVLRSILRRAVRFGRQTLGIDKPFLADILPTLVEQMKATFPELEKAQQKIADVLTDEEEAFGRTLDQGLKLFDGAAQGASTIKAEAAFQLHDTYGFPIDLTSQMAEERGLTVDIDGFHKLMEEAKERSRGGSSGNPLADLELPASAIDSLKKLNTKPTDDGDKFTKPLTRGRVQAIWNGRDFDQHASATTKNTNGRVAVVFNKTNFYAEMGGQVADTGKVTGPKGTLEVEQVKNCAGYVVHIGRITKGTIAVDETAELAIEKTRRTNIEANHTSTHILNLALRAELGAEVDQRGSLVEPGRLRFDFAHNSAVDAGQAATIEAHVRRIIEEDQEVYTQLSALEPAKAINTLRAVFGETYPDPVRVVSVGVPVDQLLSDPENNQWGAHSVEFCGGTHLARTSEAQAFVITAEESVSKGVRRMQALTREPAQAAIARGEALLNDLKALDTATGEALSAGIAAITERISAEELPYTVKAQARDGLVDLQKKQKAEKKAAASAGKGAAVDAGKQLAQEATGSAIVGVIPAGSDRDALLAAMDAVRAKHEDAAVLLISPDEEAGKLTIVAKAAKAAVAKGIKCGDWVRATAQACDGKGGGKPDSAQGGGSDVSKLDDAVAAAQNYAQSAVN